MSASNIRVSKHEENMHTMTDNGTFQLLIKAHSSLIIIFYLKITYVI